MEKVKQFPELSEYRDYESRYLDSDFLILMIHEHCRYEKNEERYPGTVWNQYGRNVFLYSDWEDHKGRTTYAEIGGCYYAARLAVCEKLVDEKRQATVIIFREVHPGYIMPVGVWNVRETVRNAMKQKPLVYNTLSEALKRVASQLRIPLKRWIQNSELLQNILFQRRITDFLNLEKL